MHRIDHGLLHHPKLGWRLENFRLDYEVEDLGSGYLELKSFKTCGGEIANRWEGILGHVSYWLPGPIPDAASHFDMPTIGAPPATLHADGYESSGELIERKPNSAGHGNIHIEYEHDGGTTIVDEEILLLETSQEAQAHGCPGVEVLNVP